MSMTSNETVPDPALIQPDAVPPESDSAEALRRRVYMGFAGIVTVGLALAGLYIGGRLFAQAQPKPQPLVVATIAHPAPQAVLPKPSPLEPQVRVQAKTIAEPVKATAEPVKVPSEQTVTAAEPAPASAPETKPDAPFPSVLSLINPKAGEKYLQLAALGPGARDKYLKELEARGIHASVAPGPTETLYRVVLGPYADRSELKQQQDALEAAGIQSMERVY